MLILSWYALEALWKYYYGIFYSYFLSFHLHFCNVTLVYALTPPCQQCLCLTFNDDIIAVILAGDFWLLDWNGSSCNWNRNQKKNILKISYRGKTEPSNFLSFWTIADMVQMVDGFLWMGNVCLLVRFVHVSHLLFDCPKSSKDWVHITSSSLCLGLSAEGTRFYPAVSCPGGSYCCSALQLKVSYSWHSMHGKNVYKCMISLKIWVLMLISVCG